MSGWQQVVEIAIHVIAPTWIVMSGRPPEMSCDRNKPSMPDKVPQPKLCKHFQFSYPSLNRGSHTNSL